SLDPQVGQTPPLNNTLKSRTKLHVIQLHQYIPPSNGLTFLKSNRQDPAGNLRLNINPFNGTHGTGGHDSLLQCSRLYLHHSDRERLSFAST
ncbi:MAG TPA: hypothetical protein PKX00_04515, partial [Opitutaceae bacterium]|nr:hypothetical protein [Opitutaceae bacterium]